MITSELSQVIRMRCIRDGEPIGLVACELGLSKSAVSEHVRSLQPVQSRLDTYRRQIDDLILGSPRITAVRVRTQLQAYVDPDLQISQRALRAYVAKRRRAIAARGESVRPLLDVDRG